MVVVLLDVPSGFVVGVKIKNYWSDLMRVVFDDLTNGGKVFLEATKLIVNKEQGFIRVFGNGEVWELTSNSRSLPVWRRPELEARLIYLPGMYYIGKAGD